MLAIMRAVLQHITYALAREWRTSYLHVPIVPSIPQPERNHVARAASENSTTAHTYNNNKYAIIIIIKLDTSSIAAKSLASHRPATYFARLLATPNTHHIYKIYRIQRVGSTRCLVCLLFAVHVCQHTRRSRLMHCNHTHTHLQRKCLYHVRLRK